MVSDWKHKSQFYKTKACEMKGGGKIREQRHTGGMRRYIAPFLHIIVSLIIGIDGDSLEQGRRGFTHYCAVITFLSI